jgi:hypothetical protein
MRGPRIHDVFPDQDHDQNSSDMEGHSNQGELGDHGVPGRDLPESQNQIKPDPKHNLGRDGFLAQGLDEKS